MTPRLTHLALHVRDLDATAAFYQDYCSMRPIHERKGGHERNDGGTRVLWLAEPGRDKDFIIVMMPGGPGRDQADRDYSHLGFACESREAVDAIAARAEAEGCLVWAPREEPFPVGYYCGLRDPDGNFVEFSYGQPLGPGAGERDVQSSG